MGLTCSKIISEYLKGDTCLKSTKKGLSIFAFKIQIGKIEELNI
jgi:hypothetical protein